MEYDEKYGNVFAQALFPLLQENEGVIVHNEGKGYIVCKSANEEVDGDDVVRVRIIEDDSVLQYPHLNLIWVHDEPVGNA